MNYPPNTRDLRALLIEPQEKKFRARFGLERAPLELIVSGYGRLVVAGPKSVFLFPRHEHRIRQLEREAEVLSALDLEFAPRVIGFHRDEGISPYPFLELSRISGTSYDVVAETLSSEAAAEALENLSRCVAQLHEVTCPPSLAPKPEGAEKLRVSDTWTTLEGLRSSVGQAAQSLAPYLGDARAGVWEETLAPIATMQHTTIHGELSDGNFLIDESHRITGLVDWCDLHVGHPLRDLDFGRFDGRWSQMRRRLWEAYASERVRSLPEWGSVNLFWSLLDAMTLLAFDRPEPGWSKALANLAEATQEIN